MTITTEVPPPSLTVKPAGTLGRLGRWCYRRRRLILFGWVSIFVVVSGLGAMVGSRFAHTFSGGHTQSQHAAEILAKQFPSQSGDVVRVVFDSTAPITSPVEQARVATTVSSLQGAADVSSVIGPFDSGGVDQVSRDGHVAYAAVRFTKGGDALPLRA